jgi:hypothetical protein
VIAYKNIFISSMDWLYYQLSKKLKRDWHCSKSRYFMQVS